MDEKNTSRVLPRISVIVPVYNVESYLEKCLTSIIRQTYHELQIIVVDDGSTDKSGKIADDLAKNDERIIVVHQANKGLSAARNAGLEIADGAYIGFVDSDDWVYPEMYEHLLHLLIENQADIAQCGVESNVTTNRPVTERVMMFLPEDLLKAAVTQKWGWTVWRNLYRAEIWNDIRFDEGYYYEDTLIFPSLIPNCKKCVQTNKILYYYTRRKDGILRTKKNPTHLASQKFVYNRFLDYAKQKPQNASLIAYYICGDIASFRQIIRRSPQLSRKQTREHKHLMHELYQRLYAEMKNCDIYKQTVFSKKVLWGLYYFCPTAANCLLTIFKNIQEEMRKQQ